MWPVGCEIGGGQGGIRTVGGCPSKGDNGRNILPVGSLTQVANCRWAGCLVGREGVDGVIINAVSEGASNRFIGMPGESSGVVVDFSMVKVSSHWAN